MIREKNSRLQEWHHTRIDRAWQTKLQEREAVRVKIEKQRQKRTDFKSLFFFVKNCKERYIN